MRTALLGGSQEPGKVRITILLDENLVDHFDATTDASRGKAGYQTLINSALQEFREEMPRSSPA